MLAYGGVEVQLPIFGPACAAVYGVWENIMAASGGNEYEAICIEEAVRASATWDRVKLTFT